MEGEKDYPPGGAAAQEAGQPPPHLQAVLAGKLLNKTFDAGGSFCFVVDSDRPEGHRLQLSTTRPLKAFEDIFLVDHAWSYRNEEEAREVLCQSEALRRRLLDLLEISTPPSPLHAEEEADLILSKIGPWTASYWRPSGNSVMYIMDEVGSRLQHPTDFGGGGDTQEEVEAAFACSLVMDEQTGFSYTAFWPVQDVDEGEVAYCRDLPNRLGLRLAALDVLGTFDDPPRLPPEEVAELHQGIQQLHACLQENGFMVSKISELLTLTELGDLLPVWDLSSPPLLEGLHAQITEAREAGSCSRALELLISLFLFRMPVSVESLINELGKGVWDCLCQLGLIYPAPDTRGHVISLVQLSPVATSATTTLFMATDFAQASKAAFDPVMYIGIDTLGLVSAVPRVKVDNVLDLCAGCGVQGLSAAQLCAERVTLVELNPRAARFARFNAVLNGCANRVNIVNADILMLSKLGHASLVELLGAESFDHILANPPYIPSGGFSGLHKYGDGGKSGEEVLQGVVKLSAKTLSAKGTLFIVANLVNIEGLPDRVGTWWTSSSSLEAVADSKDVGRPQVAVFHGRRWSVQEYASLVAGGKQTQGEPNKYGKALLDAGVTDISNGFIFVKRGRRSGSSNKPEDDKKEEVNVNADKAAGGGGVVKKLEDEIWQVLAIGREASHRLKEELSSGA